MCSDVKIAFAVIFKSQYDSLSLTHNRSLCKCNVLRICIASPILYRSFAISLRVIVIFVEYDFICRCHYAVSVAIYVATGVLLHSTSCLSRCICAQSASCCYFFFARHPVPIQMLHLPKRWKSDLPNTLSLSTLLTMTFESH